MFWYPYKVLLTDAIASYLEYLAIEVNRSPLTIEAYRRYLTRLLETVGDIPLESLTREQVRSFRRHLYDFTDRHGESLSVKTQSNHIVALRALLRYARKQGVTCLAPDELELPKTDPREVSALSAEQLEALLATPDVTTMAGLRDRAILETLFSTGLRVAELTSLQRTALNTSTGEVRVVGKGRKERIVFISERARIWLQKYLDRRLDDLPSLFVGYRGKGVGEDPSPEVQANATPLTARSIDRIVTRHTMVAGIVQRVTPHTMRHSFATDLLLNGADIRSVQTMLGHASLTTTQVYTHVTNAHLREVHERFHGKKLD